MSSQKRIEGSRLHGQLGDPTDAGMMRKVSKAYEVAPFSRHDADTRMVRTEIAEATQHAFESAGVLAALNEPGDHTLIFSSVSTGENEKEFLEMLDRSLTPNNARKIYAVLSDLSVAPEVHNDLQHITIQTIPHMDAQHLDVLASANPLVLCERLGALWHMARIDEKKGCNIQKYPNESALLSLLQSYKELLGNAGVLIIDSNPTVEAVSSTWDLMLYAYAGRGTVTLDTKPDNVTSQTKADIEVKFLSFLSKQLGVQVSVHHFESHKGIRLSAIQFANK